MHACKKDFRCDAHEYKCANIEKCINITSVCNGVNDCSNNADEGPSCDLNECTTIANTCNDCKQTPTGPFCKSSQTFLTLSLHIFHDS